MSEWPWSLRSPKDRFKGLRYPLTWSNWFCCGRGKRGRKKGKGSMTRNVVIINFWWIIFFWGREDEDKRKQEDGQTWNTSPPNGMFWTCIKNKIRTLTFGARSFLLVSIVFTPSEGPKGFVNWFSEKSDHKKKAIFHGPWSQPAVRICPPVLVSMIAPQSRCKHANLTSFFVHPSSLDPHNCYH